MDDPRVAHVAGAATATLATLRQHDHWGFKDPRTCLTAAYWLDLEPELRFVVCVRHPIEVALSLRRRNQNSYSLGLSLWERYYATVLDQVPPERRIVSHYDTFFVDPEAEMARLCAFAGLEPAPPQVRRDLRHHSTGIDLGDAGVSDGVRALYAELCREAGAPPPRPGRPGRGPGAPPRPRRRGGAAPRRPAPGGHRAPAGARGGVPPPTPRPSRRTGTGCVTSRPSVAAARLAATEGETARTLAALRTSVARIDERTRRMEARSLAGIVGRAARAAARRLPQPAEQSLQRGRRLAQRAAAEPAPTAKAVAQRTLRRRGPRRRSCRRPPSRCSGAGGRPTAGRPPNPARRPSRSPGACPTRPSASPAAPGWRARRSG